MIERAEDLAGSRLSPDEPFRFACHDGLACFTTCCANKRLPLLPYDVLRLRRALAMPSDALLERYADLELDPASGWPLLRLRLDDRGRCPFLAEAGCSVYLDRPTCCRIFPLARAVALDRRGGAKEIYLLERRPAGCLGLDEPGPRGQTVAGYAASQGLEAYRLHNNRTSELLPDGRGGRPPLGERRTHAIIFALYNLDVLRRALDQPDGPSRFGIEPERLRGAPLPDEELLALGHAWIGRLLELSARDVTSSGSGG